MGIDMLNSLNNMFLADERFSLTINRPTSFASSRPGELQDIFLKNTKIPL
jgi:hypothetical protein